MGFLRKRDLLSPDLDTERRRRIWPTLAGPLEDIVLDHETPSWEFRVIARRAVELKYADDEIRAIFWREVFPAVAGAWLDSLNPDWTERIRDRPTVGLVFTCVLRPWWIWFGWRSWRNIKREIDNERKLLTKFEEIENDYE
jgi:hypothetical protein